MLERPHQSDGDSGRGRDSPTPFCGINGLRGGFTGGNLYSSGFWLRRGISGIPIALCCPEIAVTLAESQGKKAAFLREAVRVLGIRASVHGGRAEELEERFDCVTLRAVDRMDSAVAAAGRLVRRGGWLALMTSLAELARLQNAVGPDFEWIKTAPLAGSEKNLLAVAVRLCE